MGRVELALDPQPSWQDEDKMEITVLTKLCPKCGIEKPASEFGKANRRDGLRSYCKKCEKERQALNIARAKQEVYDKLGNVCCQCGFADKRALQIDHVNGGGNKEHKEITNTLTFLKKVSTDVSGTYQLLCANCNWIKRMERLEHNRENKISEQGMQNIFDANIGRQISPETRQKMSDSHKGQTPWNKNPDTEEKKKILHEAALKREANKRANREAKQKPSD